MCPRWQIGSDLRGAKLVGTYKGRQNEDENHEILYFY